MPDQQAAASKRPGSELVAPSVSVAVTCQFQRPSSKVCTGNERDQIPDEPSVIGCVLVVPLGFVVVSTTETGDSSVTRTATCAGEADAQNVAPGAATSWMTGGRRIVDADIDSGAGGEPGAVNETDAAGADPSGNGPRSSVTVSCTD